MGFLAHYMSPARILCKHNPRFCFLCIEEHGQAVLSVSLHEPGAHSHSGDHANLTHNPCFVYAAMYTECSHEMFSKCSHRQFAVSIKFPLIHCLSPNQPEIQNNPFHRVVGEVPGDQSGLSWGLFHVCPLQVPFCFTEPLCVSHTLYHDPLIQMTVNQKACRNCQRGACGIPMCITTYINLTRLKNQE
jgi:hypothetical protein